MKQHKQKSAKKEYDNIDSSFYFKQIHSTIYHSISLSICIVYWCRVKARPYKSNGISMFSNHFEFDFSKTNQIFLQTVVGMLIIRTIKILVVIIMIITMVVLMMITYVLSFFFCYVTRGFNLLYLTFIALCYQTNNGTYFE